MMKSILICHEESELTKEGIARWLATFTNLEGIIVIKEKKKRLIGRIKKEIKRVGFFRFLDVIAFRVYYRIAVARKDDVWRKRRLEELRDQYPIHLKDTAILLTSNPNTNRTQRFMKDRRPDIVFARCKYILKEKTFSIPKYGTYVAHPGICPEYRNAHGCFWALANNDVDKVGMTLLRVDNGIDTGPVYEYFTCDYDEVRDSHVLIQEKMTFDNLDGLKRKLTEIAGSGGKQIDTTGRRSNTWGQPWLTKYIKWKWQAKRRSR